MKKKPQRWNCYPFVFVALRTAISFDPLLSVSVFLSFYKAAPI